MSQDKPLDRPAPYSEEAERAVVGCCMIEPESAAVVLEMLRGGGIHLEKNRTIFSAMQTLAAQGCIIDEVSLGDQLARSGVLVQCGGREYLSKCISSTPSAAGVEDYCRIILRHAASRRMIEAAGKMLARAYEGDCTEREALALIGHPEADQQADKDVFEDWIADEAAGQTIPISTGFKRLDASTNGGMRPGELWIVAGRTSMGKTAFALNIAKNAKCKLAYYSYEMSGARLGRRLLSCVSGVPLSHIINGMTEDEREAVVNWGESLRHIQVRTRERRKCATVQELQSSIASDARVGFRVVFVDYLGLVRSDDVRIKGEGLIAELTSMLKQAAEKHGITIVAMSQLNRALEARTNKDKKPQLSDMRGGGSIEQDADVALMLYRPDYYEIPDPKKPKPRITDGILAVGKNRDGDRNDEIPLKLELGRQLFYEAT